MNGKEILHADTTWQINGAFREVYNTLGWGFLESVYLRAMEIELKRRGLACDIESKLHVKYRNQNVGEFRVDMLVEHRVIVELKAVEHITGAHEAQLMNYLKASGIQVGLLCNFGPKPEQRRIIWTFEQKALKDS